MKHRYILALAVTIAIALIVYCLFSILTIPAHAYDWPTGSIVRSIGSDTLGTKLIFTPASGSTYTLLGTNWTSASGTPVGRLRCGSTVVAWSSLVGTASQLKAPIQCGNSFWLDVITAGASASIQFIYITGTSWSEGTPVNISTATYAFGYPTSKSYEYSHLNANGTSFVIIMSVFIVLGTLGLIVWLFTYKPWIQRY